MKQGQIVLLSSLLLAGTAQAAAPKYVFYFIGDGMGSAQRQVAEYYLQQQKHDPSLHLTMDTLPVTGITTTHSANSLVTDSAAAGTALAAGVKTNNGVIGLLPNGTKVTTLLEQARDHGMKTGVVTTTRLTHATPASFISKNPDRDNESAIAEEYLHSGVDYMAGGGYSFFVNKNSGLKTKRKDDKDLVSQLTKAGYTTFISEKSTDSFMKYQPKAGDKIFGAFSASHLPYSLDQAQQSHTPSLAQLVDKGVTFLSKEGQKKGFFMMVEGGRIDHAGHAHDITGNIDDTLALDEAVKSAMAFYQKHPKETLIIVAADHETGGMGLGFGKNYYLKLDQLAKVKQSIEDKTQKLYTGDRAAFYAIIDKQFGLTDLSGDEKKIIEQSLDVADKKDKTPDENLWGEYDPAAIGVAHVISQRANIYWTTYAHTGVQVPLSAIGVEAQQFGGFKDNTEVAKTLAKIMNFKIGA
ncbi:alkaline phosphatase [uncultured Tolumonas sp.]|uniref:alkaline phosphatase n=1 Tax=uncultured Tolumonas sp. TaxID=263765 RepID=UPI00292F6516|nr:alkaline phosphatase [uncultured Tolumonas sp.]